MHTTSRMKLDKMRALLARGVGYRNSRIAALRDELEIITKPDTRDEYETRILVHEVRSDTLEAVLKALNGDKIWLEKLCAPPQGGS